MEFLVKAVTMSSSPEEVSLIGWLIRKTRFLVLSYFANGAGSAVDGTTGPG